MVGRDADEGLGRRRRPSVVAKTMDLAVLVEGTGEIVPRHHLHKAQMVAIVIAIHSATDEQVSFLTS